MKKFLLFSVTCILYTSYLQAQQPLPHKQPLLMDPLKDKKEISGYTIHLKLAVRNIVLFEIFRQGIPVYHHPMNPVSMLPGGFATKEDAFKVAEWMIKEYGKQKNFRL